MAKKKLKRRSSSRTPRERSAASRPRRDREASLVVRPTTKSTADRSTSRPRVMRVMLVDDHELMRNALKELVSGQPNLVVCGEAADYQEALRVFEEQVPDLMTVDISLKSGNGLELVKALKAKRPDVRIIVLSMFEENLYAERALRAGAMAFVSKQQPSRTVLDAIHAVLSGEIFLSQKMTSEILQRAIAPRPTPRTSLMDLLSDRELEIFQLLGSAASTAQIAKRLHLSISTVETYRTRLKNKLNLKSTNELIRQATVWMMENG